MGTFEKDFEVDNITGENQEGLHANRPVRRLTATSIIGDRVENPQGEDLGSIKNLMINIKNGAIEYAVLQYGGLMGLGAKLFAIPFSELRLDPAKEVFILNREKEYLKNSPGFDKDHWPETNSHYYEQITSYWGPDMGPNSGAVPY